MAYVKIIYQNSPSTATPINAENLNHMDDQIALNDQRLTDLEGAHVSSFNGRTGAVTPADGDYDIGQIAPLTGAQVGQVPVVVNVGTEEDPELKFAMGAGGGGGHVIQNASGTDMPQESAMQFADSFVSDDEANGKTIVENIKEVDPADYASTTDEGIIVTDDGDDALIGPVSDDYVEVTADGTKTFAQMFNALFTDVDTTKITNDSILVYQLDSSRKNVFHFVGKSATQYVFTFNEEYENSGNINISTWVARIGSSSNFYYSENGLSGDVSGNTMPSGRKFILYYGNKKAVVDLQTTANRCLMSNGSTVQRSLDNISNPSRASVSVLTYATSLSEGIYFYTTSANTADNPVTSSFMFMIFKAATGITVFGMALASRDAYMNASSNSGNTWSGWKAFSLV